MPDLPDFPLPVQLHLCVVLGGVLGAALDAAAGAPAAEAVAVDAAEHQQDDEDHEADADQPDLPLGQEGSGKTRELEN